LRQVLKYDARPVIFDEFEGEDLSAQKRIQNVLELMRQASTATGAEIIKGSTNGKAMSFRIRSCFAFSSIGVNLSQHADASRVTILSLTKNTSPTRSEDFRKIQRFWADEMTPDYCRALRSRAVNLIPVIRTNARVFSRAAAELLGNQRAGDQVGALLAGAYSLHNAKEIGLDAAREWVQGQEWSEAVAEDEGRDETRCLSRILEHTLRVNGERVAAELSIAELVEIMAYRQEKAGIGYRAAEDALARIGIVVDASGGTMMVSNTKIGIAKILEHTAWPSNWGRILSRLDGAAKVGPMRFGPGPVSRGVSIPLSCMGVMTLADQADFLY
jgi:putative DNA primase/helicase